MRGQRGRSVSAPHCFHLLTADEVVVTEGHQYGLYISVCGELLSGVTLPGHTRAADCDREIIYCPDCLRVATELNRDASLVGRRASRTGCRRLAGPVV